MSESSEGAAADALETVYCLLWIALFSSETEGRKYFSKKVLKIHLQFESDFVILFLVDFDGNECGAAADKISADVAQW